MSQAELDPVAILAALNVTDAVRVAPVTGGQDTAIWRVEHGGEVSALRVFRADQVRMCRREVAAMAVASAGGIPVPMIRAEGAWEGRPVLLLSWCAGRTLVDAFKAQPWRIGSLGTACGRMHARIHAVRPPDAFRDLVGDWIDWAGPVDSGLRARLLTPPARADALLHLDYHPLNVMADGRRVTAVLDWPNARVGDPRADLARTVVLIRFLPGVSVRPIEVAAARLFLRAWWRGYQRVAGHVADMAPFYAWAGLVTMRDQEKKIGRPGIALQSSDLDPLRRWTAMSLRRARL